MPKFTPLHYPFQRYVRRARLGNSGAAAIEFALVAPMLALLLTGGFDFGRALFEQLRVTAAARAGAQYAIRGSAYWPTTTAADTGIVTAACNDAGASPTVATTTPMTCTYAGSTPALSVTASECTYPGGTTTCSTATCTSCVSGTYVKVLVSESFSTLVNYPFVQSPFTITGQSLIRVQ